MTKSAARLELETQIHQTHQSARDQALQMVSERYGTDIEAAFADTDLIGSIQQSVGLLWQAYRTLSASLEALEHQESYPAVTQYCRVLDGIAALIPENSKQLAYYPYSGIDLYWARIFNETVFQDIGFDGVAIPNIWWNLESYSLTHLHKIRTQLTELDVIPSQNQLHFFGGDVQESGMFSHLNERDVTLIVKGGHGFLQEITHLTSQFGCLVLVDTPDDPAQVHNTLTQSNYQRQTPQVGITGSNWLAPYAMPIGQTHIYVKK